MKVAFASDIHLNFVREPVVDRLCRDVNDSGAELFLIAGDISEAPRVKSDLDYMRTQLKVPLRYVLGNHDFYHGSRAAVREALANDSDYIDGTAELFRGFTLVGADGWYDGDLTKMPYRMSDWHLISELDGLSREELTATCGQWSNESATGLFNTLKRSIGPVVVLTHVPPFERACLFRRRPVGAAPGYSSRHSGAVIGGRRDTTVLCGHTHEAFDGVIEGVRVVVHGTDYGSPSFELIDL